MLPRRDALLLKTILHFSLPLARTCALRNGCSGILEWGSLPAVQREPLLAPGASNISSGKNLACIAFPSTLTPSERSSLLLGLPDDVEHLFLLEFKTAERNIEFPAVLLGNVIRWLCAHPGKDFFTAGGLEGFLYEVRSLLTVRRRHTLLGGMLLAVEADRLKPSDQCRRV